MKDPNHSGKLITVVADDRERSSGVIEILAELAGISVEVRRLRLGDFDVGGRLLIERKTTTDFALSVIDGRLFRQVYRLSRSDRRTCLIVEGCGADLTKTNVSRPSVQGAMITVTLLMGQPVLRSRDATETAWLMIAAAQQLRRRDCRGPGRLIRGKNRTLRRIQSEMLQAVPGLGPDKADAILENLGNIQDVTSADLEDLVRVPGIGKVTAKRIVWALGNSSDELRPP